MKIVKFVLSPLHTNCYVIYSNVEAMAIDPGWPQGVEAIVKFLDDLGLKLKFVVATHGHFDHVLGVAKLKELTDFTFLTHVADLPLIKEAHVLARKLFNVSTSEVPEPDSYVVEGSELSLAGVKLKVLETPGHTMGSITLVGEDVAFTGDTLFKGTIGRVDFPHSSSKAMVESLRKLANLPKNTTLYPGHGEHTRLDEELLRNYYLRKALKKL
ncbi:MAG: hypothetical protein B7O98_07560 [Zestosphaera tikiterensis]|uniref:Metallo-beta-lactamase domain-containing protein n=1 Tax=Zestosphaera tikiterensis TaxID=1973259 RepID=A0A2R7Y4P7_9CREN|nr:MAG: hypothetical protein B7O98_07560 [Zestosphaera tikiterensis]